MVSESVAQESARTTECIFSACLNRHERRKNPYLLARFEFCTSAAVEVADGFQISSIGLDGPKTGEPGYLTLELPRKSQSRAMLHPLHTKNPVGSARLGWRTIKNDKNLRNLHYALGLRTFLALHDLELHLVAFLQALVAFGFYGAVVNENIRTVFLSDESEALCIVEPFHCAFNARHLHYTFPDFFLGRTRSEPVEFQNFPWGLHKETY